ncbi:hypothetical protein FPV67DRAFT_1472636 [Lyophyllum atratum]|nr:hypothetical protein FPV67DRAFT_1472636 [Lyophyllum atratum]
MSVSKSHLCSGCEVLRPAKHRCAGCSRVWYCSKRCQTELWPLHIFHCKVDKPIKTLYYFVQAARRDLLPDHAETLKDYGFERLTKNSDKSKLLGLYIGLFYLDVNPRDVHNWRVKGTLVKEIKAAFEKIPVASRGGYYPWFLANQYVLDDRLPRPEENKDDLLIRAWRFTGGSKAYSVQQIIRALLQLPTTRQLCHEFYRTLLIDSMTHPDPTIGQSWVAFGFCTCRDSQEEGSLGAFYHRLIERCTFDQFATAYESGTLVKFMESRGMGSRRRGDMEDVLGGGVLKSIWYLKQLAEAAATSQDQGFQPHPSVLVDYGFINCKSGTEYADLRALYKQVLDMPEVNPLDLHEAAIHGKLFEFVGRRVKLKKKVAKQSRSACPAAWSPSWDSE